jgi:hypothetical protein
MKTRDCEGCRLTRRLGVEPLPHQPGRHPCVVINPGQKVPKWATVNPGQYAVFVRPERVPGPARKTWMVDFDSPCEGARQRTEEATDAG